jgi:hypothetical protein
MCLERDPASHAAAGSTTGQLSGFQGLHSRAPRTVLPLCPFAEHQRRLRNVTKGLAAALFLLLSFQRERELPPFHKTMTAFAIAFSWKLLLPLLVVVALLDLLTASDERKVSLLRKQGMSQRAIAGRLGISRHAVAKLCKAL